MGACCAATASTTAVTIPPAAVTTGTLVGPRRRDTPRVGIDARDHNPRIDETTTSPSLPSFTTHAIVPPVPSSNPSLVRVQPYESPEEEAEDRVQTRLKLSRAGVDTKYGRENGRLVLLIDDTEIHRVLTRHAGVPRNHPCLVWIQ
jgi:hypothetical protein